MSVAFTHTSTTGRAAAALGDILVHCRICTCVVESRTAALGLVAVEVACQKRKMRESLQKNSSTFT